MPNVINYDGRTCEILPTGRGDGRLGSGSGQRA